MRRNDAKHSKWNVCDNPSPPSMKSTPSCLRLGGAGAIKRAVKYYALGIIKKYIYVCTLPTFRLFSRRRRDFFRQWPGVPPVHFSKVFEDYSSCLIARSKEPPPPASTIHPLGPSTNRLRASIFSAETSTCIFCVRRASSMCRDKSRTTWKNIHPAHIKNPSRHTLETRDYFSAFVFARMIVSLDDDDEDDDDSWKMYVRTVWRALSFLSFIAVEAEGLTLGRKLRNCFLCSERIHSSQVAISLRAAIFKIRSLK